MFDFSSEIQLKLLKTAAALITPWVVRAVVLRMLQGRTNEPRTRYTWRKATQYVATAVMVLAVGRVWLKGLETLTTLLGLVGAGIAVALNQPISNVAGWLLIVSRRPFEVGDRVQIGATKGDVIDVGVFQFTLMEVGNWVDAEQSTGRIIHVPNARVFSDELANYNRGFGFIWVELPVLVTFESNWRRAKEYLGNIANELTGDTPEKAAQKLERAATRFMLRSGTLTPIVYTSVRDSGVMLTVRILTPPGQRRTMEEQLWERVLDAFADDDDIDFAYPTKRVFDGRTEGKHAVEQTTHD